MGENRITLRHGTTVPTTNDLELFELGCYTGADDESNIENDIGLYIKTRYKKKDKETQEITQKEAIVNITPFVDGDGILSFFTDKEEI